MQRQCKPSVRPNPAGLCRDAARPDRNKFPAKVAIFPQTAFRAQSSQQEIVGVNRTGDDPWNHYVGDSAVVDFKGTPLCEADASEGVFTARLDKEALDRFRTKFPAWRDADDFLLR